MVLDVLREMIDLIGQGTLGGQSFEINLANGGEVIEYNADYALPDDAKALAETTVKGIVDGSITIPLP